MCYGLNTSIVLQSENDIKNNKQTNPLVLNCTNTYYSIILQYYKTLLMLASLAELLMCYTRIWVQILTLL